MRKCDKLFKLDWIRGLLKSANITTLVMLMVAMAVAPVASEAENIASSSIDSVGEVVKIDTKIEAIENTRTSAIIQVGDILISLKSNPQHTRAVMKIEDLQTKEEEILRFRISEKSGKYTTKVYHSNGMLAETFVTDYDPLEPGVTAEILAKDSNTENVEQMATRSYHTWWDSVYFVKGSGTKYPHPDTGYYGIYPWEGKYINGNKLKHAHIADYESEIIAQYAPAVAGAVIGAYCGGVVGAVAGATLGLVLGGVTSHLLLDETGCIWYWSAHSWAYYWFPFPPPIGSVYYVPKYFRTASYTLWDNLGMGDP